jgi:two-component system, NtrC family, sensor kinase
METMTRAAHGQEVVGSVTGVAEDPSLESRRQRAALKNPLGRAGELAVADRMVTEIAHEIGTPLNVISGYVQMMRERDLERATIGAWLGIVETQIARIATALRSMQERVHQSLAPRPTDPRALADRACEALRPRLERMQVALDVRAPAALPDIDADPAPLELALVHLLGHALEGVTAGSRLVLVLSLAGSRVRLELIEADDEGARAAGPGISCPTETPGLDPGLGLSIARTVVEAHGGAVGFRREPGRPACLTIDLPAALPEPRSA